MPNTVFCPDGSVHANMTSFVRNFDGMDVKVKTAGTLYGPLEGMQWKGTVVGGDTVAVKIETVSAAGGVENVIVQGASASNNDVITLNALPGGEAAVVSVTDKRFENTLDILRMTCGWGADTDIFDTI